MSVRAAAIVGAGTMGTGIAMAFANAGFPVALDDASDDVVARAQAAIERTYARAVERGRLTGAQRDERLRTISFGDGMALENADVAVEAVFEDLAVKQTVFAGLGARCRADALLATNTSTLDVDAVAADTPHLERTLGLHFFSPAHVMRLLEIVRGSHTSQGTIEAAVALGLALGKVPVVVGNCDGFVGNRMLLRYRREAEVALERGATPAQVDGALQRFGFAMGPFAVADLAGIDIGWRAKQERKKRGGLPFRVSNVSDRLVEAGRLGQKTSLGYYRYLPSDRTPHPDPAVEEILAAERARIGAPNTPPSDDEIVSRCLAALVNEGARILEEGMVSSASDIDTIWRTGYGFPASRGGPMAYADALGPATVLESIDEYSKDDPAFWQPAPLLVRLVARGATFDSLAETEVP